MFLPDFLSAAASSTSPPPVSASLPLQADLVERLACRPGGVCPGDRALVSEFYSGNRQNDLGQTFAAVCAGQTPRTPSALGTLQEMGLLDDQNALTSDGQRLQALVLQTLAPPKNVFDLYSWMKGTSPSAGSAESRPGAALSIFFSCQSQKTPDQSMLRSSRSRGPATYPEWTGSAEGSDGFAQPEALSE